MASRWPDAERAARIRRREVRDLDRSGGDGPPSPSEILAQVGFLLLILLGLAVVAQLLVNFQVF